MNNIDEKDESSTVTKISQTAVLEVLTNKLEKKILDYNLLDRHNTILEAIIMDRDAEISDLKKTIAELKGESIGELDSNNEEKILVES